MTSSAELLAFLITEGLLPMSAGEKPSAPPPSGAVLRPEERARQGFSGPGVAMRYPAADGAVIGDIGPHDSILRLECEDTSAALAVLDQALTAGLRDVQVGSDAPVSGTAGVQQRVYMVRVAPTHYARVQVRFGADGQKTTFEAKVTALKAVSHTSGAKLPGLPAGPAQPAA